MTENRPLVSIITPSLNAGRFIERALRSVTDQDYGHVEHVVVDGGSTDGTMDILARNPRVRVISAPGSGQTEAINRGISVASGEIIGWLNSDDFYLPGALAAVVHAFERDDSVDVVYGEMQFVDASGRFVRHLRNTPFDKRMLFFYGCYIPSTATFWRRRVTDEGHLLDTGFRVAMDWEWFMRMTVLGYHFQFVNRLIASFTKRADSISATHQDLERMECEEIWRTYLPYFSEKPVGRLKRKGLWYWFRAKRVVLKAIHPAA